MVELNVCDKPIIITHNRSQDSNILYWDKIKVFHKDLIDFTFKDKHIFWRMRPQKTTRADV